MATNSVVFEYKEFRLSQREFDRIFERDGSYRDFWWFGASASIVQDLLSVLRSLPYRWQIDGIESATSTDYFKVAEQQSSPTISIWLPEQILLNCWWDGERQIYGDLDPKDITEKNCKYVFQFLREIGTAMERDIFFGDDGPGRLSAPEKYQVAWTFVAYDVSTDSFYLLR